MKATIAQTRIKGLVDGDRVAIELTPISLERGTGKIYPHGFEGTVMSLGQPLKVADQETRMVPVSHGLFLRKGPGDPEMGKPVFHSMIPAWFLRKLPPIKEES